MSHGLKDRNNLVHLSNAKSCTTKQVPVEVKTTHMYRGFSMGSQDKDDQLTRSMSTADKTKLCMACSKWVPEEMKSCHCGHVFKQLKSINGKRFTEGRLYQEGDNGLCEPRKKLRGSTSVFFREKITYMPGYSYEEIEEISEKRERKRKRRKPMHLINSTISNHSNLPSIKHQAMQVSSNGMCRKELNCRAYDPPLIQVLQEINNKITNQRRLWINLSP